MRSTLALLAALSLPLAAAHAGTPAAVIASAVADSARPADDRKIDPYRKPAAVLAFGAVKPGQTVGEFLPGGGYYTRLLSDIVGPRGKVYALETTRWGQENIDSTKAVLKEPHRENVSLDLSPFGDFKLPGKVDVFWTNQNYHDLHIAEYGKVDMLAFNKHVFDALKPGGTYIIIDHAAAPGADDKVVAALHRIDKAVVIREVTAAGFVLAGESDVLQAPADDHAKNVFDKVIRYHTDQFILKFRKPK
jgi:predicted methyltransferase